MKTRWFPDPDRYKLRRDAYDSRDYEREFIVMLIVLFIVDVILWLGVWLGGF